MQTLIDFLNSFFPGTVNWFPRFICLALLCYLISPRVHNSTSFNGSEQGETTEGNQED